jgi:hypothetical protein
MLGDGDECLQTSKIHELKLCRSGMEIQTNNALDGAPAVRQRGAGR